ncbi:MAG: CRTAC1 family protein [Candidatus Poribacteria bacterium]|nr:CRTAC1 family protein [Candidatus Poribacteria bacterium]
MWPRFGLLFLLIFQTSIISQAIAKPLPQFVDITTQAGIDFEHNSGAFGQKYLPETMGPGCAFIDYNNDGWQDILLVNGKDWPNHTTQRRQTMALYRNDGDSDGDGIPEFIDQTTSAGLDLPFYGLGVAVADYDNDGDLDFYLSCLDLDRLFQNQGDGSFLDQTEKSGILNPSFGTSCAWFDYDNDSYLDLFVANYVEWSIEADLFCTLDGTHKSYCTPESYNGQSSKLYRNRGDGTFADVSRIARIEDKTSKSLGVCIFDFNTDGLADIFEANDTQPNKLYQNNGDGTFIEQGMIAGVAFSEDGKATGAMGVDAGDYDGSGRESLVIGNFSNEMINLYHNEGSFFIDDAPIANVGSSSLLTLTFGCFFFDFDLDGQLDIFTANGHLEDEINTVQSEVTYAQTPHLYLNTGNGAFIDVVAKVGPDLQRPIVGRGTVHGDIDNDGDWDLLVATCGGPVYLYRNDAITTGGVNAPSWIKVLLVGTESNRNGIGARVSILTEQRKQTRTLRSGASYCSQSELSFIFGLGEATQVEQLDVRWPPTLKHRQGRRTVLQNIKANQQLVIQEDNIN